MKNISITRICCIMLTCIFILLPLSSCNEDSPQKPVETTQLTADDIDFSYELQKVTGNYIMVFKDSLYYIDTSPVVPFCDFGSIEEMRDAFFNKKLPINYLNYLKKRSSSSMGRITLCDFDNLYVPIFPESAVISSVSLSGENYIIQILYGEERDHSTSFEILSEESYLNRYREHVVQFFDSEMDIYVKKTDLIQDRNSTVYLYSFRDWGSPSSKDHVKLVRYILRSENKELVIQEFYLKQDCYGPLDKHKQQVPDTCDVYGKDNGQYFYVSLSLSGFDERPSEEWLLSLGVQPYNNASDGVGREEG